MKQLNFKNICVVTGNRAEYGLLKNLLFGLKKQRSIKLNLIVTGAHLSKKFGYSYNEIKKDGFKKNIIIDLKFKKENSINLVKTMSVGLNKYCKVFKKIKTDLLVILGDRYEIMPAALAATMSRIPIAHIHGGESTKGIIDDAIRHSITKLSHLHFATTKIYRQRIIQMGENPKNVYNVGGLGVEAIKKTKLLDRFELEKKLKIKLNKKNILVSYHPETLNLKSSKKVFLEILKSFQNLKETNIIFTMPNSDEGSEIIYNLIKKFVKKNKNAFLFKNLGQLNFYSCCKHFDLILGNSSSGLLEMPSFKKATINIGNRQDGRIKAKTVISINGNKSKICKAIEFVYSNNFKKIARNSLNPYDNGNASEKIINILKKRKPINILNKSFFDIKI
tara:strand:+ start:6737 stop:7909 length:1173 start_codon:yes stop_codon:yes gene_type:complete